MKLGFPIGISILFWSIVGLIRFFDEKREKKRKLKKKRNYIKTSGTVAACVAAHNEEIVILKTILSLKRNIPTKDIYVVSDGSRDTTADIARREGVNVLELRTGHGKSKALMTIIKEYKLFRRYEYIIIVDADTMLSTHFVSRAVSKFQTQPTLAALAAYARPYWRRSKRITKQDFISAYRTRLYRVLQWTIMYGQTWKYMNVNPVVPGFAAMYRTNVLKQLKLSMPGIWIEDFSLAFQIHKNRLGRIGHFPEIYAVYQDPLTFSDYCKQVRRWNVGFFQTVRRFGLWPSLFWLSLGVFTFEVMSFSLLTIILPLLTFLLTTQYYAPIINPSIVSVSEFVSEYYLALWELLLVFFIIDYVLTVIVAFRDKKFMLLIYGFGFLLFQFLNAMVMFWSLKMGFFGKSKGVWTPVKRH